MLVGKLWMAVLWASVCGASTPSSDPGIYPGGDANPASGWSTLPSIPGARVDDSSLVVGSANATLVHYIDSAYDATKIRRAVIQIHGENRDAWNQWLYADLAATRAASGGSFDRDEVVVMAPMFFNTRDRGAYPFDPTLDPGPTSTQDTATPTRRQAFVQQTPTTASIPGGGSVGRMAKRGRFPIPLGRVSTSSALIWQSVEWGDGSVAYEPQDADVGSFDALDAAVEFFLDRTRFPRLRKVVVAGFSLGAQLTNRYATFRADTSNDDRMIYWVSSPNSFVYLTDSRPARIGASCRETYADYKYGLNGTLPAYIRRNRISASRLVQRFLGRTVFYLVGMRDRSAGLDACAPNAQGTGHLDKMWYWTQSVLPSLPGSSGRHGQLPSSSEVRWVENTGHEDWKVITSDPGIETLWLKHWYANGTDAIAPQTNGVKAAKTPSLKQVSNSASRSRNAPYCTALAVLVALAPTLASLA